MKGKKEEETIKSLKVEGVSEKLVASHYTNNRPPRSRAKYDALKMIEKNIGRKVGIIGNRVWVDNSNHNKGFYELDDDGNEVEWFPYPVKETNRAVPLSERVIANVAGMIELGSEYIAYFDGYNEYRKETAVFMRDVLLLMEEGPFDQECFNQLVEQNSDDAHRKEETKKMARMAAIELNRTPRELKEREENLERLRKDPSTSDKVRKVPRGSLTPWSIVGQRKRK